MVIIMKILCQDFMSGGVEKNVQEDISTPLTHIFKPQEHTYILKNSFTLFLFHFLPTPVCHYINRLSILHIAKAVKIERIFYEIKGLLE